MNNKTLGLFAMAGAPFLFLDTILVGYKESNISPLTGFLDTIYVIGWLCSLAGLWKLKATGNHAAGKILLSLQVVLTTLAGFYSMMQWLQIGIGSELLAMLDFCWPLSNAFMLITALAVLLNKKLVLFNKWAVLPAGLWLITGMTLIMYFGHTTSVTVFAGTYSALAWLFLGFSVWRSGFALQLKASKFEAFA